jgi:hypothetical protein
MIKKDVRESEKVQAGGKPSPLVDTRVISNRNYEVFWGETKGVPGALHFSRS